MGRRKKDLRIEGQMSLFDLDALLQEKPEENKEVKKAEKKEEKKRKPATDLMKLVATKAPKMKNMKKVFSKEELREIMERIDNKETISIEERAAVREKYRSVKKHAFELENNSHGEYIVIFPSITNGLKWYKAINVSAMYYAYRLAGRMGRKATMRPDTDRAFRGYCLVSLINIEEFVQQFKAIVRGETGKEAVVEVTEDGIYICRLYKPLTEDEIGALRRTEEVRKDRMHNILKPKAMAPEAFNALLMSVRQVLPKMKKLEKYYYYAIGERMAADLQLAMCEYYNYSDGLQDKKETGQRLLRLINRIMSGLTVLSEVQAWPYDTASVMGENVNEIKRIIMKNFDLKKDEDAK